MILKDYDPRDLFKDRMEILQLFYDKNIELKPDIVFVPNSKDIHQSHQVVFQVKGSELTVTATDIDYASEGKENLTVNYNGEDITIGFNSKYLSEILSTVDSEEVMIEMSTPARACLILPNETDEKESILMLIMPIMVNN